MSHRSLAIAVAAALAFSAAGPAAEAGMVFVPVPKHPPGWRSSPRPVAVAPTPTSVPAAQPTPTPPGRVEIEASTWIIPAMANTAQFDFSFTRPTWIVDASFWRGRWGIGVEAIALNTTYVPFRSTPYFVATTPLIEGQLRHRFDGVPLELSAGLRSLGQADYVFGTLGGTWRQMVGVPGLGVTIDGRAGHNVQNSYFVDASAQLGYRFRGAEFSLGFRQLVLQVATDPVVMLSGPTTGLMIRF